MIEIVEHDGQRSKLGTAKNDKPPETVETKQADAEAANDGNAGKKAEASPGSPVVMDATVSCAFSFIVF